MMHVDQLIPIGKIKKTHGVEGELAINLEPGINLEVIPEFIFCMIDQLPVPFFVKEQRQLSSHSFFVFLESVDNVDEAAILVGESIYAEIQHVHAGPRSIVGVIGFELHTSDGIVLGTIDALETSTSNILFICHDSKGNEILIPGVDEFIQKIDVENRVLVMNLPEGLLTL